MKLWHCCKHKDTEWFYWSHKKAKKMAGYNPAVGNLITGTAYGLWGNFANCETQAATSNYNMNADTAVQLQSYYQHQFIQEIGGTQAATTNPDAQFRAYINSPSTITFYQYNVGGLAGNTVVNNVQTTPLTPEQQARLTREMEERRAKAAAATSRAEELMFMFIGEERKKKYIEAGHFEILVNGRVYRIQKGRSMNVVLLENGQPKMKYCAHPGDYVPDPDTMLAQYLMLTSDEKRFLSIANASPWDGDTATYNAVDLTIPTPVPPPIEGDELARLEEQAFANAMELAA